MEKLDINPPSDDYEVVIGDGDWIIPNGAKIGADVFRGPTSSWCDWCDSSFIGSASMPGSIYAVPKWVDLKVGDVLPDGFRFRRREYNEDWSIGEGAGRVLTRIHCFGTEYQAPAPPLRRMSDTVGSLKAEITKLKQENAQLAEKAENWHKLYSEKAKEFSDLYSDQDRKLTLYLKACSNSEKLKEEVVKLRAVIRAKPVLEMALREIMRETINSTDFDPEA